MSKYLSFFAFIALISAPATAKVTGNDLLYQCGPVETLVSGQASKLSDKESSQAEICLARIDGYKDGILLGHWAYGTLGTAAEKGVCIPDGANAVQLTSVIVKFLRKNPERRHNDAYIEMMAALISAYPCGE
ncbi:Rap1a/Tai family immunity protein [Vibrio cholerae]|uniref:Rap1a/Tai family immunity protein n=1 Tax=Vibrio cholerae TaxID=666 RepID=UPI001C2F6B45|nr:hypothetical protein [Vibrio cholerae]